MLSRSFQKAFATYNLSEWAVEGNEFEQRFAYFPAAFKYSYHGGPVLNLSDSLHLIKKLVNALWHSDLPSKKRNLAKVWVNPMTGEPEWCTFSLQTLEKV